MGRRSSNGQNEMGVDRKWEGSADVVRRTVNEPLLHNVKCPPEQGKIRQTTERGRGNHENGSDNATRYGAVLE